MARARRADPVVHLNLDCILLVLEDLSPFDLIAIGSLSRRWHSVMKFYVSSLALRKFVPHSELLRDPKMPVTEEIQSQAFQEFRIYAKHLNVTNGAARVARVIHEQRGSAISGRFAAWIPHEEFSKTDHVFWQDLDKKGDGSGPTKLFLQDVTLLIPPRNRPYFADVTSLLVNEFGQLYCRFEVTWTDVTVYEFAYDLINGKVHFVNKCTLPLEYTHTDKSLSTTFASRYPMHIGHDLLWCISQNSREVDTKELLGIHYRSGRIVSEANITIPPSEIISNRGVPMRYVISEDQIDLDLDDPDVASISLPVLRMSDQEFAFHGCGSEMHVYREGKLHQNIKQRSALLPYMSFTAVKITEKRFSLIDKVSHIYDGSDFEPPIDPLPVTDAKYLSDSKDTWNRVYFTRLFELDSNGVFHLICTQATAIQEHEVGSSLAVGPFLPGISPFGTHYCVAVPTGSRTWNNNSWSIGVASTHKLTKPATGLYRFLGTELDAVYMFNGRINEITLPKAGSEERRKVDWRSLNQYINNNHTKPPQMFFDGAHRIRINSRYSNYAPTATKYSTDYYQALCVFDF